MRLKRETVELMAEAIRETDADEFVLDLTSDGKLRFAAVEIVERERPLGLTKLKASRNADERSTPVA